MIIDSQIPNGCYIAGQQIHTLAPVIIENQVTLSAPQINLQPGFLVELGSDFKTTSDDCQ